MESHAQLKPIRQWLGHTILAAPEDMYSTLLEENAFKSNQFEHFSKPFKSNIGDNRHIKYVKANTTRNSTTVYKRKYIKLEFIKAIN